MWCFVQRFSIFFLPGFFLDFVFIHSLRDLSLFYAVYLHKNILRFYVPYMFATLIQPCLSVYLPTLSTDTPRAIEMPENALDLLLFVLLCLGLVFFCVCSMLILCGYLYAAAIILYWGATQTTKDDTESVLIRKGRFLCGWIKFCR